MNEILYNLVNSSAFWFVLLIWLLICIAWKEKREAFLARLASIIGKPMVFEKDPNPEQPPLFPRRTLEAVAMGAKNGLVEPLSGIAVSFSKLLKNLWSKVYNPNRPMRIAGYVFFFFALLVFVYADAIAIVNGLDAFGLLETGIPTFLTQYSIAVTMGSLFSVVIGALVFKEVHSEKSYLSDWEDTDGQWKQFGKMLSIVLVMGGFLVVITLGLLRLDALSDLRASLGPGFVAFGNIVVTILVPVNTVLATALIFEEGMIKGGILALLLVGLTILATIYILDFALTIIAYVGPFLLDMLIRIVYFLVDLVFYIVITPIDAIVRVLSAPFRWVANTGAGKDIAKRR
jgi:hypothetical protein